MNATASKHSVLKQVCNHIPGHALAKIVRKHGAEDLARTFDYWSHLVVLVFSKVSHNFGNNDLCDHTDIHSGVLSTIRGTRPARRNTLSPANKKRPVVIAEELFWTTRDHLASQAPGFGKRRLPGRLGKLRKAIHIIESTTPELAANCMGWASHRRRRPAAKAHVRLNFEGLLPACVVVDTAREADNRRARDLTAGLKPGEIVIVDRGYNDHIHFADLTAREVTWVTRCKEGTVSEVQERRAASGPVNEDQLATLSNATRCRWIRATVEVGGEEQDMVFLSNHEEWAASTIVDLYRARWEIEVFFKRLKQTLKLCDFISYSINRIRWQIWVALLVHLMLRHLAWAGKWGQSFVRMLALVCGVIWRRLDILALLDRYETGMGSYKNLAAPSQAHFPGFAWPRGTPGRVFLPDLDNRPGARVPKVSGKHQGPEIPGIPTFGRILPLGFRVLWDACVIPEARSLRPDTRLFPHWRKTIPVPDHKRNQAKRLQMARDIAAQGNILSDQTI